jgi:glucose/arabinose dehydrogenase
MRIIYFIKLGISDLWDRQLLRIIIPKLVFTLVMFNFQTYGQTSQSNLIFETYKTGSFNFPVGVVFDQNNKAYVWEKSGIIKVIAPNGGAVSTVLDISTEVLDIDDHGLLGFALDPDFSVNGFVYLWYAVDPKVLFPNENISNYDVGSPTLGRCTRYTIINNIVDLNSRHVILGEKPMDGPPLIGSTHGVGTCFFAADKSLMLSVGDSSLGDGYGGALAINRGLVTSIEQQKLQMRAQSLNSLSGKLLRIDKVTGEGLPSNPYYDINDKKSPKSRIYVKGLRNPYRVTNIDQAILGAAGTGRFLVSDTGENAWEELALYTKDDNGGWPHYEGFSVARINEKEVTFVKDPTAKFKKPLYSWAHPDNASPTKMWGTDSRISINDVEIIATTLPDTDNFLGTSSTANTFYPKGIVKDQYNGLLSNTVLFADYTTDKIRAITFEKDGNNANFNYPNRVFTIANRPSVVGLYTNPYDGYIYAVTYNGYNPEVSRLVSKVIPPVATIKSNIDYINYTNFTVQFYGDQSYDPEKQNLSYLWDFGDGITSTVKNPIHSFEVSGTSISSRKVTLTVKKPNGSQDQKNKIIYINNTAPVIQRISIKGVDNKELTALNIPINGLPGATDITLDVEAFDDHDPSNNLTYTWSVDRHHDNHIHYGAKLITKNASYQLLPEGGCGEGATYWFEVNIEVKDSHGAISIGKKQIFQNCLGLLPQTINIENAPTKISSNSGNYLLKATATSNLPLSYRKISGPIDIDATGKITFSGGLGDTSILLLQAGNGQYGNANPVYLNFEIVTSSLIADFSAATTCSGDAKPVIGASILGSVGSFNNGSSTIDKVFDNNNDTFFDGASANGQWAGLNMGTVKNISCIKFRPRNGEGKRMIGGKFQVSNNADFTNPITLYTIPSNGALEFKDYYITSAIAGGVSAQYVRYLSPDNGYGNIAEITVYTTDTVIVSDFSAATTCSGDAKPVIGASILGSVGSFNNGSSTIDKVFDNNNDTFFDGASANGQWAGLNLGTVKNISCIKFRPRNGEGKRMIGGKFQVSNNADFTNPITLYTIPSNGALEFKDYYITSAIAGGVSAQYVRYLSPDNGYGNVAEMIVYTNSFESKKTQESYEDILALNQYITEFKLYPNPVDTILTIGNPYIKIESVIIYNVDGRKIDSKIFNNNQIDMTGLTSGVYSIIINNLYRFKVIKN